MGALASDTARAKDHALPKCMRNVSCMDNVLTRKVRQFEWNTDSNATPLDIL